MALPLPKVIPDTGPGGGLVTALGGMNALNNAYQGTRYNKTKADWANLTIPAQAYSQLAYANAVGPQFIAKMLQNPGIIANLGDKKAKEALELISQYATGATKGANPLNNLPQHTGTGQPSTNNLSGKVKNAFMNHIEKGLPPQATTNPLAQNAPLAQPQMNNQAEPRPKDGVSLVGQQWYNAKGEPVYAEEEIPKNSMKLELTHGKKRENEKTWGEKTGRLKGEEKQGEEAGKFRAKALADIGQSQLALSNSGTSLKRMASIVKSPTFQGMRNKIPFFQDKQLSYLMNNGTPEEKKLIGDFISTSENIIASGVQAFGNKPLVTEFELMKRQKVQPSDSVQVAEGKLQSSIALHDIMEQKQQIIKDLLKKGVDEADAVEVANKSVDSSAIEKQTEELLRDKPTDEDIKYMAQKYKTTPAEIKKRLQAKGIL